MIGEKGIVLDDADFNPDKVLVLFEKNLDDFDLENHNPIKNSLYIDKKDLELYWLKVALSNRWEDYIFLTRT